MSCSFVLLLDRLQLSRLSNETQGPFDLVVAADGLRSSVRECCVSGGGLHETTSDHKII